MKLTHNQEGSTDFLARWYIIDPSSTKRLRMSTTALTILHGGHRKVMRIGSNESMSTVVQVGTFVVVGAVGTVLTEFDEGDIEKSRRIAFLNFFVLSTSQLPLHVHTYAKLPYTHTPNLSG